MQKELHVMVVSLLLPFTDGFEDSLKNEPKIFLGDFFSRAWDNYVSSTVQLKHDTKRHKTSRAKNFYFGLKHLRQQKLGSTHIVNPRKNRLLKEFISKLVINNKLTHTRYSFLWHLWRTIWWKRFCIKIIVTQNAKLMQNLKKDTGITSCTYLSTYCDWIVQNTNTWLQLKRLVPCSLSISLYTAL